MNSNNQKLFYSISEVAKMLELTPSQIRFWEKEFNIKISHKNAKGNRMFTSNEIKKFRHLKYLLKEKGMTIAGARAKLKSNPTKENIEFEVVTRLKMIKDELLQIKQQL